MAPLPSEDHDPADDHLAGPEGERLAYEIAHEELGSAAADSVFHGWQASERRRDAGETAEGLRERKKRLTRQRISNIATTMFAARGFEQVRVADVAARAGVSEKTVYNYFPTKESLVFDEMDAQRAAITEAVSQRPAGLTPTDAVLGALHQELDEFRTDLAGLDPQFLRRFGAMIHASAALRAAISEHRAQLVDDLSAVLAQEHGQGAADPEPMTAARALASLLELFYDAPTRWPELPASVDELCDLVWDRMLRAATLIDTSAWAVEVS